MGSLEALKGKKIAMTWAYSPSYGKPLSVPQGMIGLMTRFGMDVSLAYPEGYGLIPEVVELAEANSRKSGGSFEVASAWRRRSRTRIWSIPKSWAPYQVMQRRTPLLHKGDKEGSSNWRRNAWPTTPKHKDWECDEKKMKLTQRRGALHALPAGGHFGRVAARRARWRRMCSRSTASRTYQEASYKPFVIAAMILTRRFADPAQVLGQLLTEGRPRVNLARTSRK